ncbi:MAG: ABC transporter permease, partial [Pyrinomonadaceae bacterium]
CQLVLSFSRMKLALAKIDLTDALSIWQRNLLVYRRLWKTELLAPIVEPIFTFLAFGFGVGALVTAQVQGLSYLAFVGAGVLCLMVFIKTLLEATYAAYFRMVFQNTYDAILATPITVESLCFAEIIWAVSKAAIDSIIILVVVAIFGGAPSLFAPLALVPLWLCCLFLAAFSLSITARIHDIDYFNIYLALFFSSVFLTGAWFPLEILPLWLKFFAYAYPLTSAVDLVRACLIGKFTSSHLLELAYLLIVSFIFIELSLRSLRKRMVI